MSEYLAKLLQQAYQRRVCDIVFHENWPEGMGDEFLALSIILGYRTLESFHINDRPGIQKMLDSLGLKA